jgi:adenylate cyclase
MTRMDASPVLLSDPLRARQEARRRLLRIVPPVLGVVAVIVAIIGIAFFLDRANRHGALALADDTLSTLQARVDQQVEAFLAPIAQATRLTAQLAGEGRLDVAYAPAMERLAMAILRDTPQVALFSIGDPGGNYTQVRRGPNGMEVKRIRNTPPPRRVVWVRHDPDGLLTEEEDPADAFDPRTRPWFRQAVAQGGLVWTAPYIFFTDRRPGITASLAVAGEDGRPVAVVGVDVTLAALSDFIAGLRIGRSGQAVLMDRAGGLIAARDASRVVKQDGSTLVQRRADEIGDPILTRAFDMARLNPHVRAVFELEGQRHIVLAAPVDGEGIRDWMLLLTVPEDDFAGFVTRSGRAALLMSGGVVLLTALLALFLARQGLRADRARRRLAQQNAALAAQSSAFAHIGSAAAPGEGGVPPVAMEELAAVTGARRTSLWRFSADGRVLTCLDAYERATAAHITGAELHVAELPALFAALATRQPLVLRDAAADRRTAELHRLWLHPLGSTALIAVPVVVGGALRGSLWIEDAAQEAEGAADFAVAVANLMGPRVAAAGVESGPAAHSPGAVPGASPAPRLGDAAAAQFEDAPLAAPARDLAADVFPEAAVLVLRLADSVSLARRAAPDLTPRFDALAQALQEIAAAQDLPYLRVLGEQAVAAAGLGGLGERDAAERIAAAALAIRARCAELFEGIGGAPDFRLGLDAGVAIGTTVGSGQRVFNLWGEAVRGAEEMAATAMPGTVQATEAIYARLRHGFLLRPRGSFWVPRAGERRTFVLAGQL